MSFVHTLVVIIQVVFIALVFVIVFYRPHETSKENVLGMNIDINKTINICKADINKDGIVDEADYIEIKASFLTPKAVRADINKDNIVDLSDFGFVTTNYLGQCK